MHRTLGAWLFGVFFMWLIAAVVHAATITVTTNADDLTPGDGSVSLREAVTAISAGNNLGDADIIAQSPGVFGVNDTINFNIPGAGVHTIAITSLFPTIAKPVTINGYSQPGSSANTAAFPAAINAVPLIQITPAQLIIGINASGTTIRGLVLNCTGNCGDAIDVSGTGGTPASNVTIAGNFIGTNATGTANTGANGGFGVRVEGGSNHVIGGPAPADRNLIAGMGQGGVFAAGSAPVANMLIQGNFFGTDITGTTVIQGPNGAGIDFNGLGGAATNTTIINNLVSGFPSGGIEIDGNGGVVQGNLIGVARDGTSPLPNANFGGLLLNYAGGSGGYVVGGTGAGQANVIANNTGAGIWINGGTGNQIAQNSIFGNTLKDVTLGLSGTPLPNDNCDPDAGPNLQQNYPVLTSASVSAGNATISGTLNSTANTAFRIDFYTAASCSPSGAGGAQTYIGTANVTTNGACNASFGPLTFPVPAGQTKFSATATDPAGNTSELAVCKSVGAAGATTTALVSSVNPSTVGQSVTFTATVTGSSPTGTVQFMDGASNLGAAAALSGGAATLTTSSLTAGTHNITAVYSGDVGNAGSTSNTVAQQVVAGVASTTTAVTSSANPSVVGQAVTFTATISGGSNPTGTIQFRDGGANLGSPVTVSGGTASFVTAALGLGSHSITAVYSGDSNNLGSTSPVLTQVVSAVVVAPPPPSQIPTLSEAALVLLALLLAMVAAATLRASRRTPR